MRALKKRCGRRDDITAAAHQTDLTADDRRYQKLNVVETM
jgi:hypothetical protein